MTGAADPADPGPGRADELIGAEEAGRLLEVASGRVEDLVDQGLLTPVGDGPDRRFRRADVLAVRQLGA